MKFKHLNKPFSQNCPELKPPLHWQLNPFSELGAGVHTPLFLQGLGKQMFSETNQNYNNDNGN